MEYRGHREPFAHHSIVPTNKSCAFWKGRRMGVVMRRVLFVGLMGQVLMVGGCYGTAVCLRGP